MIPRTLAFSALDDCRDFLIRFSRISGVGGATDKARYCALPSRARPGNSEEFQTVPRVRSFLAARNEKAKAIERRSNLLGRNNPAATTATPA